MWSPPAWMKTNGTLVNGGHVQSQYYSALANYYVKYIQAYEDEGIPIYAVTLQNEPAISVGYPSTIWSVDEYVSFAQVLGAAFESNNIKTKIWALDDNEVFAYDYADVMQNSSSEQYIDGFGFHNYTGLTLTQPTALSYQYPDTTMHVTEITNGSYKLIEYFRNWVSSYAYWLTFIEFVDPGPGPGFWEEEYRDPETNPDFWMDSQVSWAGTPGSSTYNLNSWYYTFGQFSRYIQTGAVRIESTAAAGEDISNIAFKNPDGTIVVIVINREYSQYNSVDMGTSSKQIKIATPDGQIIDTIPGDTVATYKWSSTTGDALSKTNWSATASDTYGLYNASQAADGNTNTIWTSGTNEASGQYFVLDMGSSKTFDQITLNTEGFYGDYPAGCQVFVSGDGTNWGSYIASGTGTGYITNITLSSQTARYVKISLTSSASHWWTISDISLYYSGSGLLANTGWSATASSANGSETPSKAIDGSNN